MKDNIPTFRKSFCIAFFVSFFGSWLDCMILSKGKSLSTLSCHPGADSASFVAAAFLLIFGAWFLLLPLSELIQRLTFNNADDASIEKGWPIFGIFLLLIGLGFLCRVLFVLTGAESNYSLKRTVAAACGILTLFAAAAA